MSSDVIRGDSKYWTIPLTDTSGNPYPLIDVTVWVTVKLNTDEQDIDALYQHYLVTDGTGAVIDSDGMSILDGDHTTGTVVQRLSEVDSQNFAENTYKYDVQVRVPNEAGDGYDIFTPLLDATEAVIYDYTRAIAPPTP